MKGSFKFTNSPEEHTVRIRMKGEFDAGAMEDFAREYRRICASYGGRPHLVLADMRGTAPIAPDAAAILGEVIAYSRQNGVCCCAHLSDDTVQKLQAARLGRMCSEHDDLTIHVVSVEEAERVLSEARAALSRSSAHTNER